MELETQPITVPTKTLAIDADDAAVRVAIEQDLQVHRCRLAIAQERLGYARAFLKKPAKNPSMLARVRTLAADSQKEIDRARKEIAKLERALDAVPRLV